jgi:hypothetical protein
MSAILIPYLVVLTHTEVLFADDFCIEVDGGGDGISPFLHCLLLAAEDCAFLSRKEVGCAHFFIVGLGFKDGEFELEDKGVVRQLDGCIHDVIGHIFSVLHVSEGEPF